VRFQRATIMPKEGTVKFSITIFKGTGDFEICEAGTTVASGNIHVSEAIEKDQLKLPLPSIPPTNEEILPLNTKDVYKELRLRGYEYRDNYFQGIKSCDNYGTAGELYWFNQWVPYIDTMIQIAILSNNQKLMYLLSRLQYATIDPVFHKRLVEELPKDGGLPVYHYKNIDIIKSGGIELRGFKFSLAPRRQQTQVPIYEQYTFVPYENSHSLAKDPIRGKVHALTVLLQIMYENIMPLKLEIVEVVGERAAEVLLAPFIFDILNNQPDSPIVSVLQNLNKLLVSLKVEYFPILYFLYF